MPTLDPPPRTGRVLVVVGTASHAGKSTLVAGLCRHFANQGLRVAPFKAQNMSLNAAATLDGGEIGRAQMLQARAARATASVHMNPVLLKPVSERRSQVVLRGRVLATEEARDYYTRRDALWPVVVDSLDTLRREHDLVICEGAGSPVEINLRDRDIVNMAIALHAQAPVLLVGDIERGGVFASLVGTMQLLAPAERALVVGTIVNKFRGDLTLFEPGPRLLRELTGVPMLGVVPYLRDLALPEEDALGLAPAGGDAAPEALDLAVIRLPHLSNFDDFDPLRRTPGVHVRFVHTRAALGTPDAVLLPGSKTTLFDLAWLRESGLADAIVAGARAGLPVLGLCGGYQMLGTRLEDPEGAEQRSEGIDGLGLLPVRTRFVADKLVRQVTGTVTASRGWFARATGLALRGYEIHMGRTARDLDAVATIADAAGGPPHADGALDATGWVAGCYVHGLFESPALRRALLEALAARAGKVLPPASNEPDLDAELDRLAAHLAAHLDLAPVERALGL